MSLSRLLRRLLFLRRLKLNSVTAIWPALSPGTESTARLGIIACCTFLGALEKCRSIRLILILQALLTECAKLGVDGPMVAPLSHRSSTQLRGSAAGKSAQQAPLKSLGRVHCCQRFLLMHAEGAI